MSSLRTPFLLLLAAAALLLAGCGAAAQSDQVALQYDFKVGDQYVYDLSLDMQAEVTGPAFEQQDLPQDAALDARLSVEVTEVDDAGVATLELLVEDATVAVDGETKEASETPHEPFTIQVDQDGKVISANGNPLKPEGTEGALPEGFMDGLPFDPSQFAPQTDVIFPEEGIAKPGDSWTSQTTYPIPFLDQQVVVETSGELESISDRDGRQVANLTFNVDAPVDLTIDFGKLFGGMNLGEFMQMADQMQGMEGLAAPEGDSASPDTTVPEAFDPEVFDPEAFDPEVFEGMKGLELPGSTMLLDGSGAVDGTMSVFTDSGFPASVELTAVVDMILDTEDLPDATQMPQLSGPNTFDVNVKFTLNEAS